MNDLEACLLPTAPFVVEEEEQSYLMVIDDACDFSLDINIVILLAVTFISCIIVLTNGDTYALLVGVYSVLVAFASIMSRTILCYLFDKSKILGIVNVLITMMIMHPTRVLTEWILIYIITM